MWALLSPAVNCPMLSEKRPKLCFIASLGETPVKGPCEISPLHLHIPLSLMSPLLQRPDTKAALLQGQLDRRRAALWFALLLHPPQSSRDLWSR